MTFDHTKPFRQRNGRPARLLCDDLKLQPRCLCVAVTESDGRETIETVFPSGCMIELEECGSDLVNIPEKRRLVGFMAIGIRDGRQYGGFHTAYEQADAHRQRMIYDGVQGCTIVPIDQEYEVQP